MKKVALIFALFFMAFVNANDISNNKTVNDNTMLNRYRSYQPLKFIERGVEFFIFPNGEFDFNTHPRYRRSNNRRNTVHINTTYGAPRAHRSYNNRSRVRIEHDHLGRVRRIGNVFINYDRNGRIKRAGSIYMNYNRRLLSNLGGLNIFYNRNCRIIRTTGSIKHNMGCHFCSALSCTTNHYVNHNDWDNVNDNDSNHDWDDDEYNDDMHYYRSKKNKKAKKRAKR